MYISLPHNHSFTNSSTKIMDRDINSPSMLSPDLCRFYRLCQNPGTERALERVLQSPANAPGSKWTHWLPVLGHILGLLFCFYGFYRKLAFCVLNHLITACCTSLCSFTIKTCRIFPCIPPEATCTEMGFAFILLFS